MGRPRTPTAVKELKGSFKAHPERRPDDEPIPERGIGPAPDHFAPALSDIWDEIVSISYTGVLGEADRIALEIMSNLLYRFRWGGDGEGDTVTGLNGAELARLTGLLSQFGMTPSDRSKISVPKGKPKNGFSTL